jgi:TRAP-type mannitol/chloroaromatic compound transport system substrate-binding protein
MDNIAAMTNGNFTIDFRGGGAIVPGWEEVAAAERGVLDFGITASFIHQDEYPSVPLFNAVLGSTMFPVKMMAWMLTEGHELHNQIIRDKNVYSIPGWEGTPELFLNTTKELNTVEDLEGLKIRTAGADAAIFSALGASPVSVPPAEIYENMQRGVIDAYQLNAPAIDLAVALYEVCDYTYVSPVRQPAEYHSYFINKQSWDSLPDEYKKIFEAAVLEEAYRYLLETTRDDAAAIQAYKDYGVWVGPPPVEIEEAVIEESLKYYNELAETDPDTAMVLESMRAFEAAYDATYPRGL